MNSPADGSLQLVSTKDGSQTILNECLGSTYHSMHGAVTESQHVFIAKGFETVIDTGVTDVTILEMGLGTGLNALLTALRAAEAKVNVNYHALELFPLPPQIWNAYGLPQELMEERPSFDAVHSAPWNQEWSINPNFLITKHHVSLLDFEPGTSFDLVYFDAFEPETQPELWTLEVFQRLFSWMRPQGILTTYCCKGYVRRNMIEAGFSVEKIPGPPGKREMIRAKRAL